MATLVSARAALNATLPAALKEDGAGRKQWIAALVIAFSVAGCSRSVHWEEEVPLNTVETIWVKRSGTYTYRSASGNPLDYGYQPDWVSTTEFKYKGKDYSFTDTASLILLAIAARGTPNLVADAADHDWQWKNKYYCVTPYYVQFRPDGAGKHRTWPERIDPQLYGLPTNLIFGLPPLASSGKKFTAAERERKNASLTAGNKELRSIEPTYSTNICPRNR